jgi:hypothetical protein
VAHGLHREGVQVLGGDHIAVGLVRPLRDESSLVVRIQVKETDQIARCIVQRPPADVASLPVSAVELDELLRDVYLTNGGHTGYLAVYTCIPFRLR